jgi:hypothetical protein
MDSDHILAKLRQFLLIIAAGVFVMTVTDLFFLSHWKLTIQFLPFALCALGLITLAFAYFRPTPKTLRVLRWCLFLIAACSFIGFYEHMSHNYSFWLKIKPAATAFELIKATLGGANPILAPGILMLGAVIGLMAIYKHPLLETK